MKAGCGALGLISTTATASSNKETRQILDWVADLAAAWARCGVQLAVAADIWCQASTLTADENLQQRVQEKRYHQHVVKSPQLLVDAVLQVLLATLLLNQTALQVLHPAREMVAAALECLLVLVNLFLLTWRLQDSLLLAAAPKLLVLAVVTRMGPPVLVYLWSSSLGWHWRSSSASTSPWTRIISRIPASSSR
jgi:hypothetical protein